MHFTIYSDSDIFITSSQYSNLRIDDHKEYIIIKVQSKEHEQYTTNYLLHKKITEAMICFSHNPVWLSQITV